MDAIRAFALIAGVILHATLSFLPGIELVGIPIADRSKSVLLCLLFFVVHMFRMPLFFLLAGYFSRLLLHRLGTRRFIWNRCQRILFPLILGWICTFPLVIAALLFGATNMPPIDQANVPEYASVWLAFPLMHLWFLYILLWFYAITLVLRFMWMRVDRYGTFGSLINPCMQWLSSHLFSGVLLGLPLGLCLPFSSAWFAWFGLPTPDRSLILEPFSALAFFIAFTYGWLIHRQPELLKTLEHRWQLNLAIALMLSAFSLCILGPTPIYEVASPDAKSIAFALCYMSGQWYWTFAILGFGLCNFSARDERLRYLADASYWIYIAHLPLVFFLQVALQDQPGGWLLKFPLIVVVTMASLLFIYHWCVRATFIGKLLNGTKYPRRIPAIAVYANEKQSATS